MKVSLRWLLDHIEGRDVQGHALDLIADKIVSGLIRSTVEIDAVERVSAPLNTFFLAVCRKIQGAEVQVFLPEKGRELMLPLRPDAQVGRTYLIIEEPAGHRWALLADVQSSKEGFFPALHISADSWRERCDMSDVILTIDNKGITHRPDLWSHRGLAREVAAIQGWHLKSLPLHPLKGSPAQLPARVTSAGVDSFMLLEGALEPALGVAPWMALRLARVDCRSLNLLVDATNYVLFDIGQPLHAFDASMVQGELVARQAEAGEKLELLDGRMLSLTAADCVIADRSIPLSLAGIMGGRKSGVTEATDRILLESAHFEPTMIRHSSRAHYLRTESSVRFEKGLDATTVRTGIERFCALLAAEGKGLHQQGLALAAVPVSEKRSITVPFLKLERMLGMALDRVQVMDLLTRLGFTICPGENTEQCEVIVPSFRLTDVHALPDIAEEVVRLLGYDTVPARVPRRLMEPASYGEHEVIRFIKRHCAYACRLQEVSSYPFYDEEWLRVLRLEIGHTLELRNPVSEHMRRLVTSLIPHLLKQLSQNVPELQDIGLFEINTVWHALGGDAYRESKRLGMLLYARKHPLDFYEIKQMVLSLAEMLRIPLVWQQPVEPIEPWYLPAESAVIYHDSVRIGVVGRVSPLLLGRITEGIAYAAELEVAPLVQFVPPLFSYKTVSKLQPLSWDVSCLLPATVTVASCVALLQQIDARIKSIMLVDMFTKPEWKGRSSLSFRMTLVDEERTLTGEEIDRLIERSRDLLRAQGAELR